MKPHADGVGRLIGEPADIPQRPFPLTIEDRSLATNTFPPSGKWHRILILNGSGIHTLQVTLKGTLMNQPILHPIELRGVLLMPS